MKKCILIIMIACSVMILFACKSNKGVVDTVGETAVINVSEKAVEIVHGPATALKITADPKQFSGDAPESVSVGEDGVILYLRACDDNGIWFAIEDSDTYIPQWQFPLGLDSASFDGQPIYGTITKVITTDKGELPAEGLSVEVGLKIGENFLMENITITP